MTENEWAIVGESLGRAMHTADPDDAVKIALLTVLAFAFGNLPAEEFTAGARLLADVHKVYDRRQAVAVTEAVEATRDDCLRRWTTTVQ